MRELTRFQVQTESRLRAALARIRVRLENRLVEGERETFVRADVAGSPLRVFIYEDEAQLQGPGVDVRFEAADYDSSDQLAEAFIADTLVHAQHHREGS